LKTITFAEIENYQIIVGIENATCDPEETRAKVEAIITKNPDILLKKTRDELFKENEVLVRLGKEQKNVEDVEGERLKCIFENLGSHEKLQLSGDTIPDQRDTEYWIKQANTWNKHKIEYLGETLPQNAVLSDKLSETQQQEIAEQDEEVRLANLTPDQKAEEKEAAIIAAKREVRNLKEEAEIAGESFDAKTEYQLRKAKIDKKYKESVC